MQHDETIPKTPPATPIPDTGISSGVPTVIGKENLRPISELPPVKPLEGIGNLIEINKQPGDQIVVEGIPTSERRVEIKNPAPTVQPVSKVQKTEEPEIDADSSNVIPFEVLAKGDPTDAKVDEARIEVREKDRTKQMKEAA